jgi:hypothetical protein
MSTTRKIGDAEFAGELIHAFPCVHSHHWKIHSAIGYGAMGLGGMAYGPPGSDEERFKVRDTEQ